MVSRNAPYNVNPRHYGSAYVQLVFLGCSQNMVRRRNLDQKSCLLFRNEFSIPETPFPWPYSTVKVPLEAAALPPFRFSR